MAITSKGSSREKKPIKKSACNRPKQQAPTMQDGNRETFNNLSDRPKAYYHKTASNTRGAFLKKGEAEEMIEKNSLEWSLWADAYSLKAELTPPPPYIDSDSEYWGQVLEKIHAAYNKYKDTYLKTLAEHLFLGILLQVEAESLNRKKTSKLINTVAERLKIGL